MSSSRNEKQQLLLDSILEWMNHEFPSHDLVLNESGGELTIADKSNNSIYAGLVPLCKGDACYWMVYKNTVMKRYDLLETVFTLRQDLPHDKLHIKHTHSYLLGTKPNLFPLLKEGELSHFDMEGHPKFDSDEMFIKTNVFYTNVTDLPGLVKSFFHQIR